MTKKHFRFLKVAHEMSLKTTTMRRQFGAVIVNKSKVIMVGRNRKSHTKVPTDIVAYNKDGRMFYYGLHAEIDALLKCDFSVRGLSIYIHGQNVSTGNVVNSEPCLLCRQVLKDRGIKQAIYSVQDGYEITSI